ncbi:helix-turn-helix domain-containing protein [Leucobacter sp. GX24907]
MVFTIAGWARVSSSTDEVLLESGTILTIPVGLEYRGYPAGYTRTVTLYIHPDYLNDQLRWISITHPLVHHLNRALSREVQLQHLQVTAPVMRHLTPSLAWLAQQSSNASALFKVLSIASDIFDAVGRLAGTAERRVMGAGAPSRREVLTAIALLRADLGRVWRIDELASKVALSNSQLVRLFRTEVGLSPATFLRTLRADRMAELLVTTRLGVAEIAAVVGWSDPTVASRAFKQRYGEAPSVYASFYRS